MSLSFPAPVNRAAPSSKRIAVVLSNPGFGQHFTDHMAIAEWEDGHGWSDDRIAPYGPLCLDPGAAVFHYGQEVFEGLKAFRHDDGSVWTFRADANALRFHHSAERLALPTLPVGGFLASIEQLLRTDEAWVPREDGQSLYLRPFMFGRERSLLVKPSEQVTYCLIASPVASYFSSGVTPVNIWLDERYVRASPGGTGAAKCGGNYSASLLAQREARLQGCSQVLFLDAVEHRWVEELGGMNVFFVTSDRELLTPALSGTILEGVTRSSVLTLAPELGLDPVERRISIHEVTSGIENGTITEAFACGTAAVVTPVGSIKSPHREVSIRNDMGRANQVGTYTERIRNWLLDIQYGRRPDVFGWMSKVVG